MGYLIRPIKILVKTTDNKPRFGLIEPKEKGNV